ncbi:hypothetical protein [Frankia tisae]|uniref:hypothetical protein n=1 Tax=Frankia tisae TaxID=2950104 RepID=UPI0021BEAF2C|nr:hypothetical protein [Frankia tisae]
MTGDDQTPRGGLFGFLDALDAAAERRAATPPTPAPFGDDQHPGFRGENRVPQRSPEWLDSARPEEIHPAYERGELAEVLGQPVPFRAPTDGRQWTGDDLAAATPDEVDQARRHGELRDLLAGEEQ